jgi:hypothetical protein
VRNGEPAAGETIVLADAAGAMIAWARARADGTIAIPFLLPGPADVRDGSRSLAAIVIPAAGALDLGVIELPR